jgi:hypothetical protein
MTRQRVTSQKGTSRELSTGTGRWNGLRRHVSGLPVICPSGLLPSARSLGQNFGLRLHGTFQEADLSGRIPISDGIPRLAITCGETSE